MTKSASPKRVARRPSRSPKKRGSPRPKKNSSSGWLEWFPVVMGVAIAWYAVRAVNIMTMTGPWGARALMPWPFLLHGHILHLPVGWSDYVVEGVMYAQFPFYGLMLMLLHRQYRWSTTIAIVIALHLAGFLALAAVEGS